MNDQPPVSNTTNEAHWVPAEITRLETLRQREVQSIGAAVSRRNWQETEMAYNQLRDKIDRTLLDLRRAHPPLSEYEQWQLMERGP